VIGYQIPPSPKRLGALGLVDLVSNHDGSGRISPCVSAGRKKRGLTQKLDFKFFSPIWLFQMQSGTWNNFDLEQK
jgi:hypothetical protein